MYEATWGKIAQATTPVDMLGDSRHQSHIDRQGMSKYSPMAEGVEGY